MPGPLYMAKTAFFFHARFHEFANQISIILKVFPVTLSKNGNLFAPQAKIFSLNIVQEISKRFFNCENATVQLFPSPKHRFLEIEIPECRQKIRLITVTVRFQNTVFPSLFSSNPVIPY